MKQVLFLMPRLAGYFHGCIRALVDSIPEVSVTVVAKPNAPQAPFAFEPHPRIEILDRSKLETAQWRAIANRDAALIYIAGWRDSKYRRLAARYRKRIPVVMGMDNLWKGQLKQRALEWFFSGWVRSFCNHVWVPGLYQYEYARRLGFPRDRILTGLYSANTSLFDHAQAEPGKDQPKYLVFVGNMWRDKGVHELVQAFTAVADSFPNWRLQLIGGGPLVEEYAASDERIAVLGFRQPEEVAKLFLGASAFCLPSYHDQWGVVIHEACCAGLPVIATSVCGAVSAFVHEGYNGFRCAARDVESLSEALVALMSLNDADLSLFGERSRELSRQITRELWVARVAALL